MRCYQQRFIVSVLILMTLFSLASVSYADKIVLNNGREIDSDRVWEEKGLVKAVVYGEIVAYPKSSVYQVIIEEKQKMKTDSFQYDLWAGGMRIEDVMEIAERDNIPIRRNGLNSANKNFDPGLSRKYMYSATEFEYFDKVLGKDAKALFYFTPNSRILYKLEAHEAKYVKRYVVLS